jgi:hypothetical protein
MEDEPRKIFIDEDWKAQVQREREQAKIEPQQPAVAKQGEEAGPEGEEAPSAFAALIQSVAAQCAFALGLIAPPDTKQVMVNLEEARYCVDTLVMLREKTKGNLTPEEQGLLSQTLAELQQVYAVRSQQIQEAQLKQAGVDLKKPPKP